jgi:hypothetical protein
MKRIAPTRSRVFSFLFLVFMVLVGGCGQDAALKPQEVKFSTDYVAVFLDSGQVYFGQIDAVGTHFVTLKDIFYIQRQVSQDKKEEKILLVKRGQEFHGPEMMRINLRHITLLEPVAPNSRVAQLIKEAKGSAAASEK